MYAHVATAMQLEDVKGSVTMTTVIRGRNIATMQLRVAQIAKHPVFIDEVDKGDSSRTTKG
ncbi:hypothetical protein AC578_9793 [Pseudocercospora eumusae]|uniref:Uncharacterized protein n=1 Tax=Pseudocercospora eumusae TaxID=321146 RepID=A0A139GUQ6_9PEZI|nr:hypothetical protein AC578_9793 [Pseudocercospora eumusae]